MAELNSSSSGTGSKTTVTTTGGSPQTYGGGMFGTGDLAGALLQTIRQGAAAISNLGTQMTGQQQQSVVQDTAATELGKQAAAEKYVLATKKAETEYQQNTFLEGLQSLYNVNPAAVGNEISRNLAVRDSLEPQVAALENQRIAAKTEYDAAAGVDLLSNPIGYIMAQLKLPALAARHNALAQNKDSAQGTIDQANNNIQSRLTLLDASKKTNLANLSDQIRENALAEAKVSQIIADSQLKAAEAANSAKSAGFLMQQIQLANMGFDNQRQGIMSIAQLRDMGEQTKWRNEQRAQMAEARKDALDRKKADAEQDAALDARLKVVSDQLGMVIPMTVHRLRGLTDKDEQQKWLFAATKGWYGPDVGSAVDFYLKGVNPPGVHSGGATSMLDTAKRLQQTGAEFRTTAEVAHMAKTGQKLSAKDASDAGYKMMQAELEASTSSGVIASADLSNSKYDPGKTYNPYRAPVLGFVSQVMANPEYASLRSNPVVTGILALNKEGKYTGEDMPAAAQQMVIASVKKQIKAGQISDRQGAEAIQAFYRAASDYNQKTNMPTLFGLGHQDAYMFSIEGGAGKTKTNLFDATSIQNTLVKQIVRETTKHNWGGGEIGGLR